MPKTLKRNEFDRRDPLVILISRISRREISSWYLREKITPEERTFNQSDHRGRPIELRELINRIEIRLSPNLLRLTRIDLIVPLGNFSVRLVFIATILTPMLHRIPKAMRNPNELRKAI